MKIDDRDLKDKFWSRVTKTDTCWLWPIKTPGEYGWFGSTRAHRMAFFLTHGRLDKNLHICHRCDVRNCVRPDHLFEGTRSDNMKDAYAKGRLRILEYSKKSQFKKGNTIGIETRIKPGEIRDASRRK